MMTTEAEQKAAKFLEELEAREAARKAEYEAQDAVFREKREARITHFMSAWAFKQGVVRNNENQVVMTCKTCGKTFTFRTKLGLSKISYNLNRHRFEDGHPKAEMVYMDEVIEACRRAGVVFGYPRR